MNENNENDPTLNVDEQGNSKPVLIGELLNELIVKGKSFLYMRLDGQHFIFHTGYSAARNCKTFIQNTFNEKFERIDMYVGFEPHSNKITKELCQK